MYSCYYSHIQSCNHYDSTVNYICVCSSPLQGVLRDDGDVKRLGEDFEQMYQARKADLFSEDGW